MPFSFSNLRPPNPFGYTQKKNNRNAHDERARSSQNHSQSASAQNQNDLRHYPLLRGVRDVNEQQAAYAANQRAPLNSPITPNTPNAPYDPGQVNMTYHASQGITGSDVRAYTNPFAQPPQPQRNAYTQPYQQPHSSPNPYAQPRQFQPQSPQPQPRPQPQLQPQPSAYPQQPLTPADAAEQFRLVNKNLPDGVMYEPLDDETIRLLKDHGKLPQAPKPAAPSTNALPAATGFAAENKPERSAAPRQQVSSALDLQAEAIERLMQDERNAQVFYDYLSHISPRDDFMTSLSSIATQCRERSRVYASLLERLHKREFVPSETTVNTFVPFQEGVALAVVEENKSLRALSELLETLDDDAAVKAIQNIINRKIVDHNLLHFIKTDAGTGYKL